MPETISITVETIIHSTLEKVWQCWTDPAHITQWCFASDDWHAPAATNDLRSGGSFTTRMEARDGSFGFDFGGVYDVVIPLEKISYTMDDGRRVQIDFLPEADYVRVTERFDAETENSPEMQQAGWQAILDNYRKHVESSCS